MITIFWLWLLGSVFAFLYYSTRGKTEYNPFSNEPVRWFSKYTAKQIVAFSLTWFVWLIRGCVRAIIWMAIILWEISWDMSVHLWEKWRDE